MSGGYVAYNLRPNKAVERNLFIDLLTRVNRKFPISNYTYIGFGGTHFEDFKLMHAQFDTKKMISLEGDNNVHLRQKFNLPYFCIEPLWKKSDEFINEFIPLENSIIWLDFANANEYLAQINDFHSLITKIKVGDIVKITLNANPYTFKIGSPVDTTTGKHFTEDVQKPKRVTYLINILKDYLPFTPSVDDVTLTGLPCFLSNVLKTAAAEALKTRLDHGSVIFQPLTCFNYSDSQHQMMTLTGILIERKDFIKFLKLSKLPLWQLASLRWGQSKKIAIPALTVKEKQTLDRGMPPTDGMKYLLKRFKYVFDDTGTTNLEYFENYLKYYRHYPSFHRVII